MTRLHLPPDLLPGGFADGVELRLDGERAHRLRNVLRLRPGDALAVFDGCGREHEALVEDIARGAVTLRLGAAREPLPEAPVPVTVVCAFPRGGRGDWLVEKATELGVASLVPLAAERSVLAPGEGRVDRWRRIAVEAAEQCGRAVVPEIVDAPPAGALRLVADLDAAATIAEACATPPPAAVALYVGPEGGWSDAERSALIEGGARPVSLGPRRLRVETAAIVGLAQVLAATGGL